VVGFLQFMVLCTLLVLAGCATLPSDDFQQQILTRAQLLTAKFNAGASTNYDCPDINWVDGPCQKEGDTEGAVDYADHIEVSQVVNGITLGKTSVPIAASTSITLTTACAITNPTETLNNTLPHELAHVFADLFYHGDQGHNYFWQAIAIQLGVPRTDPYITDPNLRSGASIS
jgi:hypothetical protein